MSARTAVLDECEALVAHLQTATEKERARAARELHDEIAGRMVSAVMDLTAVRRRLDVSSQAGQHFDRIEHMLQEAIDHTRRMVEELRPSILDNFGLFAALRWQLERGRDARDYDYLGRFPDIEPYFEADASIALFRLAQEALAMTFKRDGVKAADLHVRVADGGISLRFTDDGVPVIRDGTEVGASTALASMRHRIRSLGGSVSIDQVAGRGTVLTAFMPMPATAAPATATA